MLRYKNGHHFSPNKDRDIIFALIYWGLITQPNNKVFVHVWRIFVWGK